MTYVYSDSTAVLGPLATHKEPHAYDLCARHAESFSVPHGWEVIRLAPDGEPASPTHDELLVLAAQVREKGRHVAAQDYAAPYVVSRFGHLRLLPAAD
jgi:hypothetical protein